MASTFVIGATTATFHAKYEGSTDTAGDLERMSLAVWFTADSDWSTMFTLVTTKYQVHVPVSSDTIIVDTARGAGVGVLTIPGLITCHAYLVDLRRNRWARAGQEFGQADFLIYSIP